MHALGVLIFLLEFSSNRSIPQQQYRPRHRRRFILAHRLQRPSISREYTGKSYEPSDWLLSPKDLKRRFVYLAGAANEIHLAIGTTATSSTF